MTTPHTSPIPRVAYLRTLIDEGRLIRDQWIGEDAQGRETACLLAALSPEAARDGSASACPASIMPAWLAYLTPWMDDSGSDAAWPAMVRRYADLAARWHVLAPEAWERCKFRSLAIIVREAMMHTTHEPALAACRTVAGLCDRAASGDPPPEAEWRAAAAAAAAAAGHLDPSLQDFVGVAHALRAEGFDTSEDGTGRGTPIVPIAVDYTNGRIGGDVSGTLEAAQSRGNRGHGVAVCFDETQITSATNRCNPQPGDPCHPIPAHGRAPTLAFHARQDPDHGDVTHPLDTDGSSVGIFSKWRVRRLMPIECERLQGFPDGYTDVPYRRRNWTPDGPRYKALGNSMAVNVMRWIGTRIAAVDALAADAAATEQAA